MVTSCGTTESIELSQVIKETVWIWRSKMEIGTEVEDEKCTDGNHFIRRNKINSIPLLPRHLGGREPASILMVPAETRIVS